MPTLISFRGVSLHVSSPQEVVEAIESGQVVRIATANPEFIELATTSPHFAQALSSMTHVVLDGIGLVWMLKLWAWRTKTSLPIVHTPGVDLMGILATACASKGYSLFLLGGRPGAAEATAQKILQDSPNLKIVGYESGGLIDSNNPLGDGSDAAHVTNSHADCVFVAFGAPKQELWIEAYSHSKPAPKVMVGLGGSFDFTKHKHRAPRILRTLRLEWLYRGVREKGHLHRIWRAVPVFTLKSVLWIIRQPSLRS